MVCVCVCFSKDLIIGAPMWGSFPRPRDHGLSRSWAGQKLNGLVPPTRPQNGLWERPTWLALVYHQDLNILHLSHWLPLCSILRAHSVARCPCLTIAFASS